MIRCGNCNGNLTLSSDKTKLICNLCNAEFQIDASDTQNAIHQNPNVSLAEQLFDTSLTFDLGNGRSLKSFEIMCSLINEGNTIETCIDILKTLSMQHRSWSMENINENTLYIAANRLNHLFSADEIPLFYKDGGIIQKGQSGILISNKNVFCFSKKNINRLSLGNIFSIHAVDCYLGHGFWYFNANNDYSIDSLDCSPEEHGVIMTLICLLAQKYKKNNMKIKVCKGII